MKALGPWLLSLFVALCATGCGSSTPGSTPVAPSPVPAPPALQPGPHVLTLQGFDLSSGPIPPCSPLGVPAQGKNVKAYGELRSEGQGWVFTSRQEGDLTLRFTIGPISQFRYTVSGTLQGFARDAAPAFIGARDVGVAVTGPPSTGGAGAVTGTMTLDIGQTVTGRVDGTIIFSDSQGRESRCSAVDLLFMRGAL
jgi:hypothetical protein